MKNNFRISPATWVTIFSALAIGGYLYWFYTHFDKVIKEVDRGAIQEARANPFYAAEKFLETVGKKAESQKNYSILDEDLQPYDALIIESTRVGLTESKRQRINDWISSGGHLIVLATEFYDYDLGTSRDVFLDELGVRLYENYDYGWGEQTDDRLTKVTFNDTQEITTISFSYENYLQDDSGEATFIGGNEYSDLFVQYTLDEGMITVVTDMDIWKNYSIGSHDHAMFLYQLVGGAENVWFLYNTIQPSLLSVIVDLIPMVVISFILLIIVILFSASWRKGTPKSDDLRIQREIMQHIEAAGEFSYRNDDGHALLSEIMRSLESRLTKSIHQYSRISDEEKLSKLSQLSGKSKSELLILWQDEEQNQDSFIKKVLLIKELQKQL